MKHSTFGRTPVAGAAQNQRSKGRRLPLPFRLPVQWQVLMERLEDVRTRRLVTEAIPVRAEGDGLSRVIDLDRMAQG